MNIDLRQGEAQTWPSLRNLVDGYSVAMGLDISLTSPAFAVICGDRLHAGTFKPGERRGPERLCFLQTMVASLVEQYKPDVVAMEGYAFGAKSQQHSLGEGGGAVKLALWGLRIPTIVVPPTTLKKFATGSGNAEKALVSKELFKHFGVDLTQNDEVDASAAALIARAIRFPTTLHLTKAQLTEIGKAEKLFGFEGTSTDKNVRQRKRAA